MPENPTFSIIIPVKNAAGQIRDCLESIKKLNYPQEKIEIILADGLSHDATREIGEGLGAKVISNLKQTVAPARNIGFSNSKGEYIAFSDADCVFTQDHLKNCLKYFKDTKVAGISGPIASPAEGSAFERSISFIYELAVLLCGAAHREKIKRVEEVKDIGGCNSIYRRDILEKAMPIDERLLTAEDVDLNFKIGKLGYKLLSVPDVKVFHRRRGSPRKLFIQFYRFAIGRLQVGKKDIRMINAIHILVGISLPVFILLIALYGINPFIFYLPIGVFAAGLFALFLFGLSKSRSLLVGLNLIAAALIGILGWSLGFMRELLFPLKDASNR